MLDNQQTVSSNRINYQINEHLFTELTLEEASMISGGYEILNDTDKKLYFYTLDSQFDPKRQSLEPQAKGTYDAPYILYDKIPGADFSPILKDVSGDGLYRFNVAGNELQLTSGYQYYKK